MWCELHACFNEHVVEEMADWETIKGVLKENVESHGGDHNSRATMNMMIDLAVPSKGLVLASADPSILITVKPI